MEQAPHRFGGVEYRVGKIEIGHVHRDGMVDIPFTRRIRDVLLAEGKAEVHHLLPKMGWISFYIRTPADVEQAIWLLRVSYLHKMARRGQSLPEVPMSTALRVVVPGNVESEDQPPEA